MPAHASGTEKLVAELRLHRSLSRAHDEYANAIASLIGDDAEESPDLKGHVQRRIMRLGRLGSLDGMSAREVSTELDYDEANTHTALKGLEAAGQLEGVGVSPKRWRLAQKHRRNRVLRLSRLVPEGRWTTYGDFAVAAYDNVRMARTIGRMAANNPAFAAPHRVLEVGGKVPARWHDDDGNGPEECKAHLSHEGVWDPEADRAVPETRLSWEDLKARLEESENDLSQEASEGPGWRELGLGGLDLDGLVRIKSEHAGPFPRLLH